MGLEAETSTRVRGRRASVSLVAQAESDDAPQRLHSIFPRDLLAFLVRSPGVGDWYLVDSPVVLGDFRGDFRLEPKAVGLDFDALQDFLAKDFVAGLHIGKLQVGENVGKQSEHSVCYVVPEVVDALWAAKESRAIDNICAAVDDGFEQDAIIARVVFEVRVLYQHDVTSGLGKAAAQSRALALVGRLKEEPQITQFNGFAAVLSGDRFFAVCLPRAHVFQDLARAVGRAVIDNEDLIAKLRLQNAPQNLLDGGSFVVNGDHDRNHWIVQRGRIASPISHGPKIVAALASVSKGEPCKVPVNRGLPASTGSRYSCTSASQR